MKIFSKILGTFILFIFSSFLFASPSFALTTLFRSANTVTTESSSSYVPYTNLNNCSTTDGLTCDRVLAAAQGNLYFKNFGTYADFGMSPGSVITRVMIRVTGKSSYSFYVGLSLQIPATTNCQTPSDRWTGYLGNSVINEKNFTTDVMPTWQSAVSASCLNQYNFENNMTWRINYSSSPAWSANIDNFEIAFDYNSGATPTPTPMPTPTPTPTPIPKTPLILIPGIGGSELKINEMKVWAEDNGRGETFSYLYPKDETVWLNEPKMGEFGDDDYFDVLRMQNDGINSVADIGINGNLVPRAYQGTINFFTANGYILNKDLFIFPYDWRKDIALTAPLLDQKINEIKTQTGSAKVDIIAHSMGGLVARNYIADVVKAQNVRKLFTLGTPHFGAAEFLKGLKYGICLKYPVGSYCLSLALSEMKDIIQNMSSGYELAPSQAYYNFYSGQDNQHPYPYKTEGGPLNYSQIKTFLTSLGYNTPLFNPSEAFHSLDANISNTNGVDVTLIAGSGKSTLGQIIEEKTISLLGVPYIHKDILNINGDGTVPLFSASLNDSGKNISLFNPAKVFYTNQEHGELVASGSALNLVKNILEGNSQLPKDVYTQPTSFPYGWLFSKHSPVDMNIYDSSGNHTGPTADGNFEANIPGSTYDTLGDAAFIFVPNNGNYNIKFEATDNGSFDFKIRKYENDTISEETLYKDIPLTTSTRAETQFDTISNMSPIIHLDENGNGIIKDINPSSNLTGDAIFDQAPPQTTIVLDGIKGNNGWYKGDVRVTLQAQDGASGSGILKTEYSLDDGQTINIYTEPFTISTEKINKLKFRSIDNAGNEENPQEIEVKIDKTPPEAKISFNLQGKILEIIGIDDLTTVQASNSANKQTLTDDAGNITELQLKPNEKENEKEKRKGNELRLRSVKYNNNAVIKFPENEFKVELKADKKTNEIKEFTQAIEIEKQIEVEANYNSKKQNTLIEVKIPKNKKQKEEKSGMIILDLMTNKGKLEVNY